MCMSVVQESRVLLAERDEELTKLRLELDHYKQQAAKEIANKTKLAQALDESHRHARELEELLQQWQLEVSQLKMYCVVTYIHSSTTTLYEYMQFTTGSVMVHM